MNTMIAVTFRLEKAYSTAPNTFTLNAFTAIRMEENPTIQIQPGTAGNQ